MSEKEDVVVRIDSDVADGLKQLAGEARISLTSYLHILLKQHLSMPSKIQIKAG